jgi:hypothetical protein
MVRGIPHMATTDEGDVEANRVIRRPSRSELGAKPSA